MPVPELNTGGVNVGNSLVRLMQLKELSEGRRLRNALLENKTDPDVLENENALRVLKTKGERAKVEKIVLDHAREGLNWVQSNVENGNTNAYTEFRDHMVKDMGMNEHILPASDTFYDSVEDPNVEGGVSQSFNKDRFDSWANRALATAAEVTAGRKDKYEMKIAYGPGNKTMVVPIKKGEEYDPEEELGTGWTLEKPQYEKTFKAGDMRHYDKGGKTIFEEWDGEQWVKKSDSPKWKAGEGEKPEYKPGAALKRMSAITSAIAKLKKGSAIDAIMLAQFPEYAGTMGSDDPKVRETAIEQLNNEYGYVSKFAPKNTTITKPSASPKPAAGGKKDFSNLWGGSK